MVPIPQAAKGTPRVGSFVQMGRGMASSSLYFSLSRAMLFLGRLESEYLKENIVNGEIKMKTKMKPEYQL